MAALDKPDDEMLADVVAYGQAVEKPANQYIVTIFKAHALDIRRRKYLAAAHVIQNYPSPPNPTVSRASAGRDAWSLLFWK